MAKKVAPIVMQNEKTTRTRVMARKVALTLA
jgi:hypothetical protein